MKTLSYVILTIIGIILLYYLWPVFIGFILVVGGFIWYLSYKAKKTLDDYRESSEESPIYEYNRMQSPDVIEAEYKEKEIE